MIGQEKSPGWARRKLAGKQYSGIRYNVPYWLALARTQRDMQQDTETVTEIKHS